MEKLQLGKSGLYVSPVGLGCMGFSHAYGDPTSDDVAISMLREAHEIGYDFYDTAECYIGVKADGSISYNEEYDDVERFNDVDEATVEEIKYSFLDMDEGVVFEDLETAYGTRLLKATAPEKHFIDIYTIYKSYELEFVLTPGADPLSDADVQMLVDFISDMEFVPAA